MASRPPETALESPSLFYLLEDIPALTQAIRKLPSHLVGITEREAEQFLRHGGTSELPDTLILLKISFWDEYRAALTGRRRMQMQNVNPGVCHVEWFHKNVVMHPEHLAWLITPPVDQLLVQKELFNLALSKLKEALKVSIIKRTFKKNPETGEKEVLEEINVPLLKEIHAIFKTLQERLEGAPVQRFRHDVRTQSVNVHVGGSDVAGGGGFLPNSPGGMVLNAQAGGKTLNLDDPGLTLEDLTAFDEKLTSIIEKVEKT